MSLTLIAIPSDVTFFTPRNSTSPQSFMSPCASPRSRQLSHCLPNLQNSGQIPPLPPLPKESLLPYSSISRAVDKLSWVETDGSSYGRSDFHKLLGEGSTFHHRQNAYFMRTCKEGINSCAYELTSGYEGSLLDAAIAHLEHTPENAEFLLESLAIDLNKQYGTAHTKTLSSFFCLAAYYSAQGQLQSSETLIDRILIGLQNMYGANSIETLGQSTRCIQLLARVYVISGKFWSLQNLMICRIKHITALHGPIDPRLLDLQKILLLTNVNGFEVDEQGENLAIDILTELDRIGTDMEMMLAVLELLRYRYHRINDYPKLSPLLSRIEKAIQFAGHSGYGLRKLIFYSGHMLVLSYCKLQRHEDCGRLLNLMVTLADQFYGSNSLERSRQNMLCMMLRQDQGQRQVPDPTQLCQSFLIHENIDKMSSDHPLFIALTKCLREEWRG